MGSKRDKTSTLVVVFFPCYFSGRRQSPISKADEEVWGGLLKGRREIGLGRGRRDGSLQKMVEGSGSYWRIVGLAGGTCSLLLIFPLTDVIM